MVWNLNFQKIQVMTVILSGVIPVGNGRKSVILYQKDFMSAFSYTVRNEFDEKRVKLRLFAHTIIPLFSQEPSLPWSFPISWDCI